MIAARSCHVRVEGTGVRPLNKSVHRNWFAISATGSRPKLRTLGLQHDGSLAFGFGFPHLALGLRAADSLAESSGAF